MARGSSNTAIARDLFVAETTVKTHVGHVPEIGSYLPMHASAAINLRRSGVEGYLDPVTGGLVLAAWTVAAIVSAQWRWVGETSPSPTAGPGAAASGRPVYV